MESHIGAARLAWLLACLISACSTTGTPPAFLRTESEAWTRWLDTECSIGSFGNMALRDILMHLSGPAELRVESSGNLDRQIPHLEVKGMTWRQALWTVSKDYGLSIEWATAYEPRMFLGLLETEEERVPFGGVKKTRVMQGTPMAYRRLKEAKKILGEERHGDVVYYATEVDREYPFPNGSSAWLTEIQRYKTRRSPQE